MGESERLTLLSPAKINLFFRILSKREDGFHEIASLMQAISFFDTISLIKSDVNHLTCSHPNLPCDGSNIIHKGRELFQKKTALFTPFHIHVEKRIPMEAGLGGGSSNLATILWALNALHRFPVPTSELKTWAGELSSDAPFFFSSGTAYATGRGEKCEDLPPLASKNLWIAKPSWGSSTPVVYKHCVPNACSTALPTNLLSSFYKGDFITTNDLEYPAFLLRPELRKMKQDLFDHGFTQVLLSGSGSSFFCLGDVLPPTLPGITFYPISFTSRSLNSWYKLDSR